MTDAIICPTLHHVTFKTTRPQEMIDWYGLVAGLKPLFQFPGGVWMSNDKANHRVALLMFPNLTDNPDKETQTGIHHHAFEYATLEDLISTYSRLKSLGILPAINLDHGFTISMYYPDPDGNMIELQVDNFGDWTESSNFVAFSPEFAANPVGVQFDPDRMVEALADGLSHAEIHRLSYAGEYAPSSPVLLAI